MLRIVSAFAAIGLLTISMSPVAYADSIMQESFVVWSRMAACARQAAKQFPDHTPEGNAKREAARLNCLRVNHLPVVRDSSVR